MRQVLRAACALIVALVLVGLLLHLSAGADATASAQTRDVLASGLINIGGKFAIVLGIVVSLYAGQRRDWRWVVACVAFTLVTLLSSPLSALTATGPTPYIVGPLGVALLAFLYTFRMRGSLAPTRGWWRASR